MKNCSNPCYQLEQGRIVVSVDPKFYRLAEVDLLIGNPNKAQMNLGWAPSYTLDTLIKEMIQEDVKEAERIKLLKQHGFEYD